MKFKKGDKVRILDGSNLEDYRGSYVSDMVSHIGKVYTIKRMCCHIDGRTDGYRLDGVPYVWDERALELVKPETIVIYRKDNEVIALDKSTGKTATARCNPADTFNFTTGAKLAFERLTGEDKPKYREVERSAKPGEYVKIINASRVPVNDDGTPTYKNGDIIKIINNDDVFNRARFREGGDKNGNSYILLDREYNVLEEFNQEEPKPQLYNGKIIFTKGDEWFKTGHIYEVKNGLIESPINSGCMLLRNEPLKDIDDVKDFFTTYSERKRTRGWSKETLELIEVADD